MLPLTFRTVYLILEIYKNVFDHLETCIFTFKTLEDLSFNLTKFFFSPMILQLDSVQKQNHMVDQHFVLLQH